MWDFVKDSERLMQQLDFLFIIPLTILLLNLLSKTFVPLISQRLAPLSTTPLKSALICFASESVIHSYSVREKSLSSVNSIGWRDPPACLLCTARAYLVCIREQHRYQSEVQAALLDELVLDLCQQEQMIIRAP